MTSNDNRVKLVTQVQQRCAQYDAMAMSDALEFARNPSDKEVASRAQRSVAIADALQAACNDIVQLINGYWKN